MTYLSECLMIPEDFELYEKPEISVIKVNADAIGYLVTAYSASDNKEESDFILALLQRHSEFLLDTSNKIFLSERLHIKTVK